jgi:hypothetical protein
MGDGSSPVNRIRSAKSLNCHGQETSLLPVRCLVPGSSANRKLAGSPIKETSNFRIARQPPRTPKSGNFSAAVFAERIGDYALSEVSNESQELAEEAGVLSTDG